MQEYRETQRFRRWWVWVIIIALLLMLVFIFLYQAVLGVSLTDTRVSNWVIGLSIIIVLGILFTMSTLVLHTHIDREAVTISFGPFGQHRFPWKIIRHYEIVEHPYRLIGFRQKKDLGRFFNMGTTRALQLTLKDQKKVSVGIGRDQEKPLKKFLKRTKRS